MPDFTITIHSDAIIVTMIILMVYVLLAYAVNSTSIVTPIKTERQRKLFAFLDMSSFIAFLAFAACEAVLIIGVAAILFKGVSEYLCSILK